MKFIIGLLLNTVIWAQVLVLGIPDVAKDSNELVIAQERVKTVFSNLGYTVKFNFYPTLRANEYANDGNIDGVFPKVGTDLFDYKNLFLINESLSKKAITYSIYSLKDTSDVDTWKDLENKRIAIIFGNKLSKTLIEKNVKSYEIYEGKSLFAIYEFLEKGRVDFVLLIDSYGDELLNNYKDKDIKKSKNPIFTSGAYLVLNKKFLKLKDRIEFELKNVKLK